MFQHTAARRRLEHNALALIVQTCVSTHSRPKAAGLVDWMPYLPKAVSTHSRPKAAGDVHGHDDLFNGCFNTQPPEGGWAREAAKVGYLHCFNTQPPEGGWTYQIDSRTVEGTFQHTAARRRLVKPRRHFLFLCQVSTHSRPKAAGRCSSRRWLGMAPFQHTAARRRLVAT